MNPRIFYLLSVLTYLAIATCFAVGITHPVFLVLVGPLIILAEYFYFLYKS